MNPLAADPSRGKDHLGALTPLFILATVRARAAVRAMVAGWKRLATGGIAAKDERPERGGAGRGRGLAEVRASDGAAEGAAEDRKPAKRFFRPSCASE